MAVPWQTDTASCRSGYDKTYDPYVPSFWPARVPNQVLTKESYAIVIDPAKPLDERLTAFANRASWLEPLGTISYTDQINNMIKGFGNLGVVEALPGPDDTDTFPAEFEVEDQHKPITDDSVEARSKRLSMAAGIGVGSSGRAVESAADVDLSNIDKVHRFPGIRR
jgi:hypothetical protein